MTDRQSTSPIQDAESESDPTAAAEAWLDPDTWQHPVNVLLMDRATLGARIADQVTGFLGSWRFVIIQTILVTIWVAGNVYLVFHFDPYPFILLNLAFSTQAAYAAPLILLAGNRAAVRDRLTLEHAAAEADLAEQQNDALLTSGRSILAHLAALEAQVAALERSLGDPAARATGMPPAAPSPPPVD
jgi:uncharacterized membrane protein